MLNKPLNMGGGEIYYCEHMGGGQHIFTKILGALSPPCGHSGSDNYVTYMLSKQNILNFVGPGSAAVRTPSVYTAGDRTPRPQSIQQGIERRALSLYSRG